MREYRYIDIKNFHYDLTKEEAVKIIKRERIYKLSDWAVELIEYINNKSKENEVILYRDERPMVLMDYLNIDVVTSLFNTIEKELYDASFSYSLEDDMHDACMADWYNRLVDFWQPLLYLKNILFLFERAEKPKKPIAKKLMEIKNI